MKFSESQVCFGGAARIPFEHHFLPFMRLASRFPNLPVFRRTQRQRWISNGQQGKQRFMVAWISWICGFLLMGSFESSNLWASCKTGKPHLGDRCRLVRNMKQLGHLEDDHEGAKWKMEMLKELDDMVYFWCEDEIKLHECHTEVFLVKLAYHCEVLLFGRVLFREVPRLYPRILTQLCPRTRSRLCPRPFEWLTPPYHLWHLKHITYWRSRIAHAAHTSWSSWWWCSSLSCSWWPVRYHPHPTPPFGLIYAEVCLAPPFGLMYAQVCLAPDLYVIITTPPHPTPPL